MPLDTTLYVHIHEKIFMMRERYVYNVNIHLFIFRLRIAPQHYSSRTIRVDLRHRFSVINMNEMTVQDYELIES